MEGDGMVAIVQGLKDASLAVTLMNKTTLQNTLKPRPISKFSVETSTNTKSARNTAAQIHDGHYTSSYQLAHCNVRPSSPPERLPEFPPQRAEPSRDQGNFEVGGYGSGEYPFSPISSHYSSQACRGGMTWPDRGSVSRRLSPTSLSSQTDPFVHSLRRYPLPISPERCISTELVQRLLNYTQNKHSSNYSTRCLNNLIEESPTRDIKTDTSSVKNIQTYTRSRADPSTSRDSAANTSYNIKFDSAKKGRSFSSTSPYNTRSFRTRADLNDSYDYLKGSSRRGRHPEVRYLNDVKKCIRQTIKQIYSDKPLVCPQIRSRYNQHQREHHKSCSDDTCPDAMPGEPQASAGPSDGGSLFPRCQPPTTVPPTCPRQQVCCFCKSPLPCSCKAAGFSQEHATESLPEVKEAQEPTAPPMQVGACTCTSDSMTGNKIADEIFKWLKGLPVYADDSPENKAKREDMVRDLADKLKGMEGDKNYEAKAKEDIKKCIDKLPMWYPGAKRDKDMFKNQIADDLFNRLTTIDSSDELKNAIATWFDEIRFESDKKVDKNNLVENLVNRLKPLVDKPDEMKAEIKDMLQELPILNKDKVVDKLASKLTNDLTNVIKTKRLSTDSTDSTDEELEGQIIDWLEDIPELSSDIKNNKAMVKSLAKKLKKAQKQGLDDEENQECLKEEVIDWIDSILRSKGEKLDSKTKNKLSTKLLDSLMSTPKIESKKRDRKSSMEEQNDYEDQIWDWLEDIVDDIEKVKTSHRKNVKHFSEKLNDLVAENADDETVESEIIDFLETRKGPEIKNKNKHAKKLLDTLKSTPKKTRISFQDEDLQQSILSEISELLEDIPSNISKNKRKEIINKVAGILAKNIHNLSDKNDNINREIVNILKKEAKMPEDDAFELASALINRVKGMPLPDESSTLRPSLEIDGEIQQLVSEEVSDILNDYNISPKKRKDLEKSINKVLTDQIVRGTDNKKAKDNIISILQNANVSEEDAFDISDRLLEKSKEMSLSYKTRDSKLGISKPRLSGDQFRTMSPMEREDFEDKAEKEIFNFIEDLTGDDSPNSRKKRKKATETLVHKLGEIMSDPDDTDKEQSIIEEVSQYLRKLSIDTDMPREEIARKLASRLQSIGFQASTPKKGPQTFYPRRASADISSIHIDDTDSSQKLRTLAQGKSDEEKEYVNKLTKLIQSWIDELSIDLNATDDKGFKETMINDLASDIIDRQKYLQLNPSAKTSDQEELEHLKYQVFRWLNKLLDTDDLTLVMQKTEPLMRQIRDVYVPELIRPNRKRTDSKSSTGSGSMLRQNSSQFVEENFMGAILDWLKNISIYQRRNSSEKREIEKLLPDLVKGLKSVLVSASSAEDADKLVLIEIVKHFKRFPLNLEQKSDPEFLQRTAAELLDYLKGLQLFTNLSDRLDEPRDESLDEPLDERLKATLEDWFKTLPIARINSTEMVQFENLKKEFAGKVKQIRERYPEDIQKFKDEITNYIKMFPIEEPKKQNQKFINDKIEQLFKRLLDDTVGIDVGYSSDKFIKKAISNWIKSLPLAKGKTTNDILQDAIDDLTSVISNMIVKTDVIQINDIKNTLEKATETFLKSVPIDTNAYVDIKSLADTLFNIVKEMSRRRSSIAPTKGPSVKAADILFDSIESWCDSLPLKGDTPEEVEHAKKVKQEIASKLIHKIGELNMNPEVFNDDFLYDEMLEDEIDDLLSDLSSEEIRNNLPAIKKDLMEKMKEARQKTQEEVAGQAYKQQLREAISKTLPSQPLSAEEQASFEVLKDNLADAFINLHYVGGDEELKNKYKIKINDEVSKFCNDYLKKHPASPIDNKKLNQDLYNALKGVPLPKEETVRKEVELVKIKDEVNDWIKELPLNNQTAEEKMQTNKMVAVLAKKIHDIEKQKEVAPDAADYDDKVRKEITKWIKKLPLTINDAEVNKLTDKLMNNLKSTEASRRVSASARHSIKSDTFDLTPTFDVNVVQPSCSDSCKAQYTMPPSSLSFEDREHLQRIRERSPAPRTRCPPSKDASVSPLPMDAGSQTEIRPWESCQPPCGKKLGQQSSGVQTRRPSQQRTMQAVGSQAEVSPHVIVKEYYWDSADASRMQGLCAPCPSQFTTPGQFSSSPSPQAPPAPCSPCPRMSPCTSLPGPQDSTGSAPSPRRSRREWEQPCGRPENPEPMPQDRQEPCTSRSFRTPKARVTRLGSFDDMEPCTRSRHEWTNFPEEDEFWGENRRFVSDEDDEPFMKERKKEEEKVRCRCRERILTKCTGRKKKASCHSTCPAEEVKRCSKCCGAHCPYPSYLYFRQ